MFKNAIRIFVFCFFCCGVSPLYSQNDKVQIDTTAAERALSFPSTWSFHLRRFETRSELELAGRQVAVINRQLEEIHKEQIDYRDRMREYQQSDDFDQDEALKRRDENRKSLNENLDRIKEVLLPHQFKRLKQIVVQYKATSRELNEDTTRVFLFSKLVSELKISSTQKKKIAEIYAKRDERVLKEYLKYEEKFREIGSESYKGILSELSEEQKAEAEEHLGPTANVFLKPSNTGGSLKEKMKK